jgi:hypothetical protein
MDNSPIPRRFTNVEDMRKYLQEHADSFEGVTMIVDHSMQMTAPTGQSAVIQDCCGWIRDCSGKTHLLHRDDLAMLLNDGILQRMKIPISLEPIERR